MEAVTVYAPGSTSNLGPGFDCLGVALSGRGDRVTASRRGSSGVRVVAVSDPRIPTDPERNTAAIAAAVVLKRARTEVGLALTIDKGLPLSAGLGGSAASAVAGAVAADAIVEAHLPPAALLEAALEAETAVSGRHVDNVVASLLGGAFVVVSQEPLRLVRVHVHPDLAFVLVTPAYAVETAHARAVLPGEVPRATAVAQAARLAALVLGLERGDADLIRGAMRDGIAEPARLPLYPGYAEARAAVEKAGAAGIAVSGAGPTLVAIATHDNASEVARALEAAYRQAGIDALSQVAQVDPLGVRVIA